jgi:hypothetical protein
VEIHLINGMVNEIFGQVTPVMINKTFANNGSSDVKNLHMLEKRFENEIIQDSTG